MSTIVLKNRYESLGDINPASPKRKRSDCEQDPSSKNSFKKSREDLPKGVNFPKDNQDVQINSGNKTGNKVMVEHPLFCTETAEFIDELVQSSNRGDFLPENFGSKLAKILVKLGDTIATRDKEIQILKNKLSIIDENRENNKKKNVAKKALTEKNRLIVELKTANRKISVVNADLGKEGVGGARNYIASKSKSFRFSRITPRVETHPRGGSKTLFNIELTCSNGEEKIGLEKELTASNTQTRYWWPKKLVKPIRQMRERYMKEFDGRHVLIRPDVNGTGLNIFCKGRDDLRWIYKESTNLPISEHLCINGLKNPLTSKIINTDKIFLG